MKNLIKVKDLENKMHQIKKVFIEHYNLYGRLKCSKCSLEVMSKVDIISYRSADVVFENRCPNCNFSGNYPSVFYEFEPIFSHNLASLDNFLDAFIKIYDYIYGEHDPIYVDASFNPYDHSSIYSDAIIKSFTFLELFLSNVCSKVLKTDENILEFQNKKPQIKDYKELLENAGYQDIKVDFNPLYGIQKIRNDIIHKGYIASFDDFGSAFIVIGKILIKYKFILNNKEDITPHE